MPFLHVPPTVAAPDLLDPKSATHNTKPRLSFSTKPMTLSRREESEVRENERGQDFEIEALKTLKEKYFNIFSLTSATFHHRAQSFYYVDSAQVKIIL